MGQKQNQNTLFHILCPKTRPTEHPRLLITSLTIKELSVYPFFSQQCSGLFTKLCALPSVLPFDGWTSLYAEQFLAHLDFYKKSHLYAIRVSYFPSLFIFCQQNCNSEGLICLFVQYSETIKESACSQLLSNSPPFFPPANRLSSCRALCFRFSHLWHAWKACSNQAGHPFNPYLTVNCKPVPWSTATIPCFAAKSLISTYCFWKDYNLRARLLWSDVRKNIKYEE